MKLEVRSPPTGGKPHGAGKVGNVGMKAKPLTCLPSNKTKFSSPLRDWMLCSFNLIAARLKTSWNSFNPSCCSRGCMIFSRINLSPSTDNPSTTGTSSTYSSTGACVATISRQFLVLFSYSTHIYGQNIRETRKLT